MNDMETLMDDPIEIALAESALALAKLRNKWATIKGLYRPIVNALQKIGIEPRLSHDMDIQFAGDAQKLRTVTQLLDASGFSTKGDRPKPGDTSWSAYWEHPDCDTKVWLYFTSSVCRRVKTGTRMVEQDVFETICGDCTTDSMLLPTPAPVLADLEEMMF